MEDNFVFIFFIREWQKQGKILLHCLASSFHQILKEYQGKISDSIVNQRFLSPYCVKIQLWLQRLYVSAFSAFSWGYKLTTQRPSSPKPSASSVNSCVNLLIEQRLEMKLQAAYRCLEAVQLPGLLLAPGRPLPARLVLSFKVTIELVAPPELLQAGGERVREALGDIVQDVVRQPLRGHQGLGGCVGWGQQQHQPPEEFWTLPYPQLKEHLQNRLGSALCAPGKAGSLQSKCTDTPWENIPWPAAGTLKNCKNLLTVSEGYSRAREVQILWTLTNNSLMKDIKCNYAQKVVRVQNLIFSSAGFTICCNLHIPYSA